MGASNYGTPNPTAAARAAANLQEKFGGAASSQINQLQSQAHMAQKPNPTANQSGDARQQYNQQQHANMSNLAQHRASVTTAQTDGAGDWDARVAERRAVTNKSSQEADVTIRQMVKQNALQMEGNGLMIPASERVNTYSQMLSSQKHSATGITQLDGAELDDDVKEDPDEDAINSDLDDPDDDAIGETEDDPSHGELMLCIEQHHLL